MVSFDSPRLIADIGGTYARFALETGRGEFERIVSFRCADYPDFHSAVTAYLHEAENAGNVGNQAEAKKEARSAAPGVSLSSPLARLTSHSR